jgi:hypothetical protein
MQNNNMTFSPSIIFMLVFFSFAQHLMAAEKYSVENIPNDVRYMLEDMYGADKKKWPALIQEKDLNHDGQSDWILQNQACQNNENCAADIFICIPDQKGKCVEYCYKEVKSLKNMKKSLSAIKCESTC